MRPGLPPGHTRRAHHGEAAKGSKIRTFTEAVLTRWASRPGSHSTHAPKKQNKARGLKENLEPKWQRPLLHACQTIYTHIPIVMCKCIERRDARRRIASNQINKCSKPHPGPAEHHGSTLNKSDSLLRGTMLAFSSSWSRGGASTTLNPVELPWA